MVGPEFPHVLAVEKTYVRMQEYENKCEFIVQHFIFHCHAMFWNHREALFHYAIRLYHREPDYLCCFLIVYI